MQNPSTKTRLKLGKIFIHKRFPYILEKILLCQHLQQSDNSCHGSSSKDKSGTNTGVSHQGFTSHYAVDRKLLTSLLTYIRSKVSGKSTLTMLEDWFTRLMK